MSDRRFARLGARLVATAVLFRAASAGAQAGPTAAPSAAQSSRVDSLRRAAVPGANIEIYLMTMGQGDLLWERFGHDALGVRDRDAGTDVVYNWGTFSFEQADFLTRFMRGEMNYWVQADDAALTLQAYTRFNRSVTVQELRFTPAQRLAIKQFVEWNALEQNKYYRYDYFRDNCATRVRDVLDRFTNGAISRATQHDTTTSTYRDHALRLMDGMFWTRTGIDIGLGTTSDRPITVWESMFIPMEVQRHIRDIRVTDPQESGRSVPLVSAEHELFVATRTPEATHPARPIVPFLLAGLALGGLALLSIRARAKRWVAPSIAILWGVAAGLLGLVLVLLWTATRHVAAYRNENLFFLHPLWLVVAAMVPFVGRGRGIRRALLLAVRTSAVLALVGGLVALTRFGQPTGAIAALLAPIDLAVYAVVLRAVYVAQSSAAPA